MDDRIQRQAAFAIGRGVAQSVGHIAVGDFVGDYRYGECQNNRYRVHIRMPKLILLIICVFRFRTPPFLLLRISRGKRLPVGRTKAVMIRVTV